MFGEKQIALGTRRAGILIDGYLVTLRNRVARYLQPAPYFTDLVLRLFAKQMLPFDQRSSPVLPDLGWRSNDAETPVSAGNPLCC